MHPLSVIENVRKCVGRVKISKVKKTNIKMFCQVSWSPLSTNKTTLLFSRYQVIRDVTQQYTVRFKTLYGFFEKVTDIDQNVRIGR